MLAELTLLSKLVELVNLEQMSSIKKVKAIEKNTSVLSKAQYDEMQLGTTALLQILKTFGSTASVHRMNPRILQPGIDAPRLISFEKMYTMTFSFQPTAY